MLKKKNIATYQLIGDLLNFKDDNHSLEKQLETSTIDWENLVKISSKHLVLTTIFCRLKQKDVLHHIPEDLKQYLEDLTSINRNRNTRLIEEAHNIVQIFQKHNIQYVFIKGMAMLLGNYYKDIGERMIGDFDILIFEEDIEKAFDILKKEGYNKLVDFNYKRPDFRHLSRQVNKHKLAAIELHRHILNPVHRDLISTQEVLKNKSLINDIAIPCKKQLNKINILTNSINDNNYFYNNINFKNSYDSLVLELDDYLKTDTEFTKLKHVSHFLNLNSIWFSQYEQPKISLVNRLKMNNYLLKIQYGAFCKLIRIVKYISFNIAHRINLVLKNKSYRLYVMKSLSLRKT